MKNKIRKICFIPLIMIIFSVCVLPVTGFAEENVELLKNCAFDSYVGIVYGGEQGGRTMPADWVVMAWDKEEGNAPLYEVTDVRLMRRRGPHGENSLYILNHQPNYAIFHQLQVPVEPNSLYCFSTWVKTECEGGLGAILMIGAGTAFSKPLFDTNGEWEKVYLYGRTGENQYDVDVGMSLGYIDHWTQGVAWFASPSLVKVKEAPADAIVSDLFIDPAYLEPLVSQPTTAD